ncbi:hypothetical protein ACQ856_18180 [Mycolicibacterium psychrotolerans]|uniref:hypothetical protein n=1 Tax=Mycolicibacterium psychrotolerans TaxID=216929 RepID=UPI003D67DC25
MPNQLHYRGDVLQSLLDQSNRGHLHGPDMCGPAAPGQILGHGAFWEFVGGEYDPEFVWPDGDPSGRTTANFKPYVDPRARARYHGGDGPAPDEIGAPTLHKHDNIKAH